MLEKPILVNPFRKFVFAHARLLRDGKQLSLNEFRPPPRPKIQSNAPKVLLFSPHPDDECIISGLALRLLREAKWNVINVNMTLGSNPARQTARRRELERACAWLGFDLILLGGLGLERINTETRTNDRTHWRMAVQTIAQILKEQQPRLIFFPHKLDGHPTHIGVHLLVLDALNTLPLSFQCHVVETEFWGQMPDPNLLVEIATDDLADMIAALAYHAGEVRRNPYHLRLPAWMMDNVRRGAELVAGRGGVAPDFAFAATYRLGKWSRGKLVFNGGKFLSSRENAARLFR